MPGELIGAAGLSCLIKLSCFSGESWMKRVKEHWSRRKGGTALSLYFVLSCRLPECLAASAAAAHASCVSVDLLNRRVNWTLSVCALCCGNPGTSVTITADKMKQWLWKCISLGLINYFTCTKRTKCFQGNTQAFWKIVCFHWDYSVWQNWKQGQNLRKCVGALSPVQESHFFSNGSSFCFVEGWDNGNWHCIRFYNTHMH